MGSWSPNCDAHTHNWNLSHLRKHWKLIRNCRSTKIPSLLPWFRERLINKLMYRTLEKSPKRIIDRRPAQNRKARGIKKQKRRDSHNKNRKTIANEFPIMAIRRSRGQKPRPASTLNFLLTKKRENILIHTWMHIEKELNVRQISLA